MNEIYFVVALVFGLMFAAIAYGQYMHYQKHGRLYQWGDPEFNPETTDYDALLPVDRERARNEAWALLKRGYRITAGQQKLLKLTDNQLDELVVLYGGKPRAKQEQS